MKRKKAPIKDPQAELSLPRWFPKGEAPKPEPTPPNTARCPKCQRVNTDLWETGAQDGQTKLTNCGHCGEDYAVKCIDKESAVYEAQSERPEPSDNVPGEYAYKQKGMEKGDVMRPDLKKGKGK